MNFNFGKLFHNFESSCTLLYKVAQSSIGRFADAVDGVTDNTVAIK